MDVEAQLGDARDAKLQTPPKRRELKLGVQPL